MGYLEFSSEKADYVLELGCGIDRFSSATNDHFEGIDALVKERTVGKDYKPYSVGDLLCSDSIHVDFARENKIPIFFVDATPTRIGIARHLLTSSPSALVTFPCIVYSGVTKREIPSGISKFLSTINLLEQSPVTEFRNAWTAHMLESYVAPIVRGGLKNKGIDRKPKIGIRYDAGHIGIKDNILSERRRNFSIKNWRDWNIGKFAGFLPESLQKFYVAKPQNNESTPWKIFSVGIAPQS